MNWENKGSLVSCSLEFWCQLLTEVVWEYQLLSTWRAWCPWDVTSSLVKEQQQLVPGGAEIGHNPIWQEKVGLGWQNSQLSQLVHWPGNSEWTSMDIFGQFYSYHHKMTGRRHLNQANVFSEKIHNRIASFLGSLFRTTRVSRSFKDMTLSLGSYGPRWNFKLLRCFYGLKTQRQWISNKQTEGLGWIFWIFKIFELKQMWNNVRDK